MISEISYLALKARVADTLRVGMRTDDKIGKVGGSIESEAALIADSIACNRGLIIGRSPVQVRVGPPYKASQYKACGAFSILAPYNIYTLTSAYMTTNLY